MKKKSLFFSINMICLGVLGLFVLLGAQVLLADIPTFSLAEAKSISLDITDYSPSKLTKIRYFDNAVYLVDFEGRKIIKTTLRDSGDQESSIIYETINQDTTGTRTQPYDIISYDHQFLVSTHTLSVYFIEQTDSNNPTTTTLNVYQDESDATQNDKTVLAPQTLTKSADNTTYFINQTQILVFNPDTKQLKLFSELLFEENLLNFKTGGGFCVDESNSSIYFSIDSQIFVLDTQTKEINKLSISLETTSSIIYLNIDNFKNIYIGTSDHKLYKQNLTDNTIVSIDLLDTFVSFDIDLIEGKIYYVDNNNQIYSTEIISSDNSDFITKYSAIAPGKKLTTLEPSTDVFSAVCTKKSTKLYQYQTLISGIYDYTTNKRLIVLDQNETYYYVFDNNYDSKSGFKLGYVLKSDCVVLENEIPAEFSETKTAKVITGISKVLGMPISQTIDTDTYICSLGDLKYGDTITIIDSPILTADSNGATFVAIKYTKNETEYVGYIDSRTIISTKVNALPVESVPNATTKNETIIYAEKNCFNKSDVLSKGYNIKILSTLDGVSKIEYYVDDGSSKILKTGYCKTTDLNTGQLSTAQILGIVLMCVSIIITIVVLIINYRRRKAQDTLSIETD